MRRNIKIRQTNLHIVLRLRSAPYLSMENMIIVTIDTQVTNSHMVVASPHSKSPNGHGYTL